MSLRQLTRLARWAAQPTGVASCTEAEGVLHRLQAAGAPLAPQPLLPAASAYHSYSTSQPTAPTDSATSTATFPEPCGSYSLADASPTSPSYPSPATDPTSLPLDPTALLSTSSSHDILAHSPLEDAFAHFFSPTQLGVQLWEAGHATTGLPWWASIPATTLALRTALLPLSLKAYAASSNIALLDRSVGLARRVTEAVEAAAEAKAAEAAAAGQEGTSAAAARPQPRLGRLGLVWRVLGELRRREGAPAFRWYLGNAVVQGSVALALTLALRRMSDSLWPGLTGEGALYFPDLTSPPLYWATLSTPYGTAGAILPLGLTLAYVTAVDRSAGGSSPGINVALKLLSVPLYCIALTQPHTVLLYWSALAASHLAVYGIGGTPAVRAWAGVPGMLAAPGKAAPGEAAAGEAGAHAGAEVQAAVGAAEEAKDEAGARVQATPAGQGQEQEQDELDCLLAALATSYAGGGGVRRGSDPAAAAACWRALLLRRPGHSGAVEGLRALGEGQEKAA